MDQPTVNIPEEVLSSLCTRFLINIPDEERNDLIRVFFQIELAHWFYIDFFRVEQHGLPTCGIKEFSKAIFKHCPFLIDHADKVDKIYAEWKEYKMSVPTYGGILLDDSLTHILMVQGFFTRTSWGFPKGKVNKEEQSVQCAIREVKEETGFDITPLIDENNYIETSINDQLSRLYIVPNVPMDVDFKPTTRGEIREVRWFMINDLPASRKDPAPKVNLGLNPNNFFMVIPFIKPLKKRIAKMQAGAPNRGYSPSPLTVYSSHTNSPAQRTQSPTSQQGGLRQNGGRGRGGSPGSGSQSQDPGKLETRRRQIQQNFKFQNMNAIAQYSRFKDPALEAQWSQGGAGGKKQKGHGGPAVQEAQRQDPALEAQWSQGGAGGKKQKGHGGPAVQEAQRHSRHTKSRGYDNDSSKQSQEPQQASAVVGRNTTSLSQDSKASIQSRDSKASIQSRDSKASIQSRDSKASIQSRDSKASSQPQSSFCSKTFLNFKFDVAAIMRAFDGHR